MTAAEREADGNGASDATVGNQPTVVTATGEIDVASAGPLWDRVEEALAASPRIVIDLSEVTFMDSTGVNLLVRAHRAAGGEDGAVTVRAPQPHVRRVLEITGTDTLIADL